MKTPIFDWSILQDKNFTFGLYMYALSILLFGATAHSTPSDFDIFSPTFFANYGIFILYFFVLSTDNRQNFGGFFRFRNMKKNILLLLLFNISAYSLNRSIPVFQDSTPWLSSLLIGINMAMLAFCFRPASLRADALNFGILVLLVFGFLLNIYEMIYMLPFYGIGVMASWFFGISVHVFVPLWFSILLFKMIKKYWKASTSFRPMAWVSGVIPLLFLSWFCSSWHGTNMQIQKVYKASMHDKAPSDLPPWVEVSKGLKDNWVTKKVLKSEMVYTILNHEDGLFFPSERFGMQLNEPLQHDPLVALTSLLMGRVDLNFSDKFQLYQATFNSRHQTEERLWSGDHLSTDSIQTTVQLFPEHRISYTEKVFTIKNNLLNHDTWRSRNTQEAIYSFYLPEGAVVTSASLWVNGVEEKSYLTTRGKADKAYKTIVGRERRDPLLLHWQEGNRISVRVFPCTPQEDRKFKIGVTAPMEFLDGKLKYTNIDFEGPYWRKAKEKIRVISEGEAKNLEASIGFQQNNSEWVREGKYQSQWTLDLDAPALSYSTFSFNGRQLQVNDFLPINEKFSPKEIYLDINSSWSRRQCNKIWKAVQGKKVYVFDGEIKAVTAMNRAALFKKLRQQRFSVFPFYKIKNVQDALVIAQGNQFTPTPSDLKNSVFAEKLNTYFGALEQPIRMFHLGDEITPYLKTLKELQIFNFQKGTLADLREGLSNNRFPKYQNDSSTVAIELADIQITTSDGERSLNKAPDHLLRLFAYNDIMKKTGKSYFEQEHITAQLIGQAKEAYVVTPVSSMVVLETAKDYERFGIEKARNSLQNASLEGSGSVPEPHEWLLIILCVITLLILKIKTFIR